MATTLPTRSCWVEINTRSLAQNYRFLQSLAPPGTDCLAVVKANAYGHGLDLCAPAAVQAGAHWLGVTSVEEAVAARTACTKAGSAPRILAMQGVLPGLGAAALAHEITCVVWEPWQIDELEHAAREARQPTQSVPVHLEIDTGMSRQGVAPDALSGLLTRLDATSPLRIEAVMTHLYASDEAHSETTATQLARLAQSLNTICGAVHPAYLSVGASAALVGGAARELQNLAARWNLRPMLRLGLALYGVVPEFDPGFFPEHEPPTLQQAREHLLPVLQWKTRIISVRTVPPGAEVGYNGTFVATEPMRLALIPSGYADGLDRKLGNRFSLLVRGQRAPLVGRVSMDHAVLDVTEIEGVSPGDEVVILGRQGAEAITAYDHAHVAGTIPWEVFTRIAPRVHRVETRTEQIPESPSFHES